MVHSTSPGHFSIWGGGYSKAKECFQPLAMLSRITEELMSPEGQGTGVSRQGKGKSEAHSYGSCNSPAAHSGASSVKCTLLAFSSALSPPPNSLLSGVTFPIITSSQSLPQALSSGRPQLRPKAFWKVAPFVAYQELRDP